MTIKQLVLSLALLAGLLATTVPAHAAPASWTVLVYLDGDNNLESAGISDVNQMEMAPDSPQVNVLVQFDRVHQFVNDDTSNGDWTTTRRYKITHDTDPALINTTMLENLGELNMGYPAVLEDFLKWGIQNYPADHYALVLWDHGSGWRALSTEPPDKAICYDDTSGDRLTLAEVKGVLGAVRASLGSNVDVVACDACIMGELEVAYALRSSVDYYVGSETNVPNDGFPYDDLLSRLVATPAMTGADLGRTMVSTYRASYSGGSQGSAWATLSAFDLSQMASLATDLNAFAGALQDASAAVSDYGARLHTWWRLAWMYPDDTGQVDLTYFTDLVRADAPNQAVRTAAEDLLATLGVTVFANGVAQYDPRAYRGVSIYYPFNAGCSSSYTTLDLAADTTWDEFLRASPSSYDYAPDFFESDDTPAQAQPIPLGLPQGRHWFHVKGDVDMGSFPAEAGKLYFLSTERVGRDCDTELQVRASDGTVLATADDLYAYDSQLLWTCPTSGVYTVSATQSALGSKKDLYGSGTAYDLYLSPVSFADVPVENWAFRQIESCVQAGIVVGYSDGYHPGEAVDRAQMATYVARVLAHGEAGVTAPPEGTQSFADVPPEHWAYRYIEYCKAQKVVAGYADGYHPSGLIDRGQMAVFISRAREPQSERPDLPSYAPPLAPSFPDVPSEFWAYKAVEYCAEHSIVYGYADGYHAELTVTRDQMAVFVARAFGL